MFMKTGRIAMIFSIFFVFISYELAKSEGPINPTPRERISFGIFTDLHYGLKDSGNRYCSDGDKRLTDIINTFNERNLPLAFMLGDYISSCHNVEQDKDKTIETLRDIDTIFKNFLGERHYVLGNHDLEYLTKNEWLSIIDRPNLNYYSFNMRGFHFVILDTMYKSDGTDATPSDFHNDSTLWSNLYVSPEELEWLKIDLKNSNGKPTFVFTHVHLYYRDEWHAVKNHEDVQRVLETYGNVQVVFQGHAHGGTDTRRQAGIHYIGLKGAVDDESSNAYAIVTVYENGVMAIEGFGREISLDLIGDYYTNSACENESEEAYNLCNQICEKMDCDIESRAADSACEPILSRYVRLTGKYPPCWNKVVFLSSKKYRGDLGGLLGADRECQSMANYAGLTGSFKAWLSDDVISAGEAMTHSLVPYVRTDGVTVADNWDDLTDGYLQNLIILDENSVQYDLPCYYTCTWTNTNSDGSIADESAHCANWTTDQPEIDGVRGYGSQVIDWWSRYPSPPELPLMTPCNWWLRLYCIEQ